MTTTTNILPATQRIQKLMTDQPLTMKQVGALIAASGTVTIGAVNTLVAEGKLIRTWKEDGTPEYTLASAWAAMMAGKRVVAMNLHGERIQPGAGVVREVFVTDRGEAKAMVYWFDLKTAGVWPVERLGVKGGR
jgi:hypothetical protein